MRDSEVLIRARGFLGRNFVWVLLLLLMTAGTLANPVFISPVNLFNILVSSSYLGCLVLAQSVVLITGHFDLSTESNMIFVAIVGGLIMAPPAAIEGATAAGVRAGGLGLPWPLALGAMLLCASLVGLVNGLMVVKLRMNHFMVTLAMMIALLGLALVVGEARNLFGIPEGFRFVGSARIGMVPVAALFLVALFALAHFVLDQTILGRRLYAVGGNRKAAWEAGVKDDRVILTAYVLSGFLCGLGAFVLVGRLGAVSASISSGALFLSVAAAVIGGVSLAGGRGTALGMLGGLLVMSSISNAMNMARIPANYIRVVLGAVILVAVFVDALRTRRRE